MAVNYLTIIVSIIMLITMAGTTSIVTRSEKLSKLEPGRIAQVNNFFGIWMTADGHIRQELFPDGRYDEARGSRQHAYTGRFEIKDGHIRYWDNTGFTATGDFSGSDTLYHGGYVFYRQTVKR